MKSTKKKQKTEVGAKRKLKENIEKRKKNNKKNRMRNSFIRILSQRNTFLQCRRRRPNQNVTESTVVQSPTRQCFFIFYFPAIVKEIFFLYFLIIELN